MIRGALLNDVDGIISGLQDLSKQFGTRKSLYSDEEYIRENWHEYIAFNPFFVATREDKIIGFVSGIYSARHLFNPTLRVLVEAFWWVDRQAVSFRRVALRLLDTFTRYGRDCADWIYFTLMANLPIGERALARRGYKLAQGNYLLEVN